jgi:hypothetical protein
MTRYRTAIHLTVIALAVVLGEQKALPAVKDAPSMLASFGSACSDKSDNASQLNSWLRRLAPANGGPGLGFLPPGVCSVSEPLVVPSGVTLTAIPGTVIITPGQTNSSSPMLLSEKDVSDVHISGLVFDGAADRVKNANTMVTVYHASNVVFSNDSFRNANGVGLLFSSGVRSSGVIGGSFHQIGNLGRRSGKLDDNKQGVAFCCGSGNVGNFVRDSHFEAIGLDSISLGNQDKVEITDNVFQSDRSYGHGGASIYVSRNSDVTITGNVSLSSTGNGIDVFINSGVRIIHNFVEDSGGAGIMVASVSHAVIKSNLVANNWQSKRTNIPSVHRGGLVVGGERGNEPSRDIVVEGNVSTDTQPNKTQEYGLQIRPDAVVTEIHLKHNNYFDGNAAGNFGEKAKDFNFLP